MKAFYALVFGATFLSQAVAAQPAEMLQAPGQPARVPYTDSHSGVTFPVSAGPFQRFRLTSGPGPDMSAAYLDPDPAARLTATIFIEHGPPGPGCGGMAEVERTGVMKDHPDAAISALGAPPMASYAATAFSARYREEGGGAMEKYFYCDGNSGQRLEYDFHHLAGFDALSLEKDLVAALSPPPEKH